MATTFNEEYLKALGERGLALVSKRSAIQMEMNAEARRKDLEQILFGDSQNYGIVSILSILHGQIWLASGRKTSKPILHDFDQAKTQYQSDFALSVTPAGDGAGGLHPPQNDNPEAGQDDVDINSAWLTDHGLEDSPSGTGVIQFAQFLAGAIGSAASANSDGRGPYTTQSEAQAQAAIDRGSGLLGLRTENSEIYSTGTGQDTHWWVGQNGIDTPDNFTVKDNILNALSDTQNGLSILLDCLPQEQSMLAGDKGDILQEFHVDLPDDTGLAQTVLDTQDFIDRIQSYRDYFGQFSDPSPSGNRADINSRLSEVIAFTSEIYSTLNDRVNQILSLAGDALSGTNKSLVFWVSETAAKPDGPYSMILAAQDVLTQVEDDIQKKDSRLSLFTTDYSQWIETPVINSIYNRAVAGLDQETIVRWEMDIIWNLVMSANKYRLLSKPLSQIPGINNDPWDDSCGEWIADVLSSGFLRNIVAKTPPAETTFFRLAAYDTSQGDSGDFARMDIMDTQSPQSDIVSEPVSFIQVDNTEAGQSVIQVPPDAGLKERDFLWIDGNIAQIIAVLDDMYALDTDYGTIASVQKLAGCYYVLPSAAVSDPEE
jgi:hypothetical protein